MNKRPFLLTAALTAAALLTHALRSAYAAGYTRRAQQEAGLRCAALMEINADPSALAGAAHTVRVLNADAAVLTPDVAPTDLL